MAGNWVPNVPDWKFTLAATYRPEPHWAFTLAGRYSGKLYTTLDNSDRVSNAYQAFDRFFVVDLRARYHIDDRTSFGFGIDNLNNDKYFFFHPFPQRTFIADARVQFRDRRGPRHRLAPEGFRDPGRPGLAGARISDKKGPLNDASTRALHREAF